MKHILILLSILLLSSPLFGQSERPETIIIPVSSLGDVSEVRKQILQNTLTDELKKHFRIVPQEKYEQVLEQVFQELEYEECSEDTCIMRVQEMLQVENVFNLQVLGEDKDTQLNLTWRTLDEKRNEEDYCEGCGTRELRKMIGGLVEKLVGEKKVEVVVEKKPEVVVEEKEKGVMYGRVVNGKWGWYKSRNEKKDGKYVGEIENGVPNGQGTFTLPDGNKYIGEWKNGKKNGQGTYTFPDGGKYVGEWKDHKLWNNILYDKNGKILVKFVNGENQVVIEKKGIGGEKQEVIEKKGIGVIYSRFDYVNQKWGWYKSGDEKEDGKYVGEIENGLPNGQGTYTNKFGDKYVGEYKDGKRNGQGTFTYPSGGKFVGGWKEEKPWNGTYYDKEGNILGKWVNGKMIKQ